MIIPNWTFFNKLFKIESIILLLLEYTLGMLISIPLNYDSVSVWYKYILFTNVNLKCISTIGGSGVWRESIKVFFCYFIYNSIEIGQCIRFEKCLFNYKVVCVKRNSCTYNCSTFYSFLIWRPYDCTYISGEIVNINFPTALFIAVCIPRVTWRKN